jgi:hypothetical protein
MCLRKSGITGYNISLAISVNKLTSERTQMVLVIIFCEEFVSACTSVHLSECSNLLVHCSIKKLFFGH